MVGHQQPAVYNNGDKNDTSWRANDNIESQRVKKNQVVQECQRIKSAVLSRAAHTGFLTYVA